MQRIDEAQQPVQKSWLPYIKGAKNKQWFEPLSTIILWGPAQIELKETLYVKYGASIQSATFQRQQGVSYSTIGTVIRARIRRYQSAFDVSGASVFGDRFEEVCCYLNSPSATTEMRALNPTINVQPGDIERLSCPSVKHSKAIISELEKAFEEHERHRETSVEFIEPGPSAWKSAQEWALCQLDANSFHAPQWQYQPERPHDHFSWAFGQTLGRFGMDSDGLLLVYGDGDDLCSSKCDLLRSTWKQLGSRIAPNKTLREYLSEDFFVKDHLVRYENRPIYWPLSVSSESPVIWVQWHKWLQEPEAFNSRLLSHLQQNTRCNVGTSRTSLNALLRACTKILTLGPEEADQQRPFSPKSKDGVWANIAVLYALLDHRWHKSSRQRPKTWFNKLSDRGPKGWAWAQQALRYWPSFIVEQCRVNSALAISHKCCWTYHPKRALFWELRSGSPLAEVNASVHRENLMSDIAAVNEIIVAEIRWRKRYRNPPQSFTMPNGHKHTERDLHQLHFALSSVVCGIELHSATPADT